MSDGGSGLRRLRRSCDEFHETVPKTKTNMATTRRVSRFIIDLRQTKRPMARAQGTAIADHRLPKLACQLFASDGARLRVISSCLYYNYT